MKDQSVAIPQAEETKSESAWWPAVTTSAILVLLSLALPSAGHAQTSVTGAVFGTCTTNGSPYYVGADVYVPAGKTLTINPGVVVVIAPDQVFTVNGTLLAQGTAGQHIIFRGASAAARWGAIRINYSGTVSRFTYCDFSDAASAAYLQVYDTSDTMTAYFNNCTFKNCSDHGIYGESIGNYHTSPSGAWGTWPTLAPVIKNCTFEQSQYGCGFYTAGNGNPYASEGRGRAIPTILGNIFRNLSGTAFIGYVGGYSTTSQPKLVNNTFYDVRRGIYAPTPFDAMVTNNIFCASGVGVERSGNESQNVRFNCFHGNNTNFVGYPSPYGQVLTSNRRGDPCDFYFNIYLDPQFTDSTTLLLPATSPGVDSGASGIVDVCIPPSQGTSWSDMGAYGGPDACNRPVVPCLAPVILAGPASAASCAGRSITFSVLATNGSITYQWYKNRQVIPGVTASHFSITDLATNDAGTYWAVVANGCGAVTSCVATLTVSPICLFIGLYAGLNMDSLQPGSQYAIQQTENLNQTNAWVTVTNFVATASKAFWFDPEPATYARRFYRVLPVQ